MPEPSDDVRALVSLIGRGLGFDALPVINGGERPPLMPADEAGVYVGAADSIPPSVKLDLLTHVTKNVLPDSVFEPVVISLVQPGLGEEDQSGVVEEVLARARKATPGTDPLGRTNGTDLSPGVLRHLKPELQDNVVSILPRCEATIRIVDGYPAMNLTTVIRSKYPLDQLRPVVNPLDWPKCPAQAQFFNRMDMVKPAAPPLPGLDEPDSGWSARLSEVVDFSYGLDKTGAGRVTTELDFVVFGTPQASGCTFDLAYSHDDKIKVDRGYLLVEDLASIDMRRTTTMKQVFLTEKAQPGSMVCMVWSLSQAMIAASCLSQPHEPQ